MFDLGMQELVVIFIVALIVFGPRKLPELARSLGKGVAELKKTLYGVKEQINSEIEEIEKPIKDELHNIIIDRPDFSKKDLHTEAEQKAAEESNGIKKSTLKATENQGDENKGKDI